MTTKTSRRGVRLASALVAAGLVLCAAPAIAVADDDSGVLSLTGAQADTLSERLQPDVYGDQAQQVDPQNAIPDADTSSDTGTDSGASTTALPTPTVTAKGFSEGATGMAATAPVTGTDGDYFTLTASSNITRRTADGKEVWTRDNNSYYKEWNLPPLSPRYSKEPYPARLVMGFNAVQAFSPASDNGYSTGDLTGDGIPDVVFTADVGTYPYRPFVHGDSTLHTGTFVTILDGATGRTLWTKLYAGAYNIKLVGKTLVVADTPYYNTSASAGSTSTLTGIRFDYADGKLTPGKTWTYDTGAFVGAAWSSLEPLGDGLVAASWNQRKTSATAPATGHTLVIDTADGSVKWQQKTDGLYSRQLHLDSSRKRLVALEMTDVNDAVRYEIAAYDLASGTRTSLDRRTNAFASALVVGDVRGDRKPEYTVNEFTLDPNLWANADTVRSLDGDTADVAWQRTVKRDPSNGKDGSIAWNLSAVDGRIVASYKDDSGTDTSSNRSSGRYARLAVLSGKDGTVNWEKQGVVASQAWAQPFKDGGKWRLRTVDTNQNIRVYDLGGGSQKSLLPMQAELSSAVLMDVNGDGKKDIVAGGQSNGVFAFDGPSMLAGQPKVLWRATVPGQIHKIVKADVDGDGKDEVVVAADTATAVVEPATGKVSTVIDGKGQYVWTVTTGDLNGDGKDEIVVPTDQVRAYRGSGRQLWSYAAPVGNTVFGEASVGDRQVYAQYGSRDAFPVADPKPAGAVALRGGTGSTVWSETSPKPANGKTVLGIAMRATTFASPDIPYADGHAVAVTWLAQSGGSVVEIRDGRTGKVLHTGDGGGAWTLGNWFTGPEGLYMVGTASVRLFAANGVDSKVSTMGDIQTGGFLDGPNGTRYLIGAGSTGFDLMDPAQVPTGYLGRIAYGNILGGREYVAGDLDGDGVDEVVSLNFDATGYDRMAELENGGYYTPYTAIRQLTVFTVS
ncbi:FG-GAP repeat domain-containing protein [Streptomyces sp. NPDC050400]|uniref:FG-GAP repeat domain-containing protein n=1 Tax=Streptomyces sp. NPDC050400 TaxID=3365610 RepID=UPI0037BA56CE